MRPSFKVFVIELYVSGGSYSVKMFVWGETWSYFKKIEKLKSISSLVLRKQYDQLSS